MTLIQCGLLAAVAGVYRLLCKLDAKGAMSRMELLRIQADETKPGPPPPMGHRPDPEFEPYASNPEKVAWMRFQLLREEVVLSRRFSEITLIMTITDFVLAGAVIAALPW